MRIILILIAIISFWGVENQTKGNSMVCQGVKAPKDSLESRWKGYINLDHYLIPFWNADTIYDEISQVIKTRNGSEGTLLFNVSKILSVRSADLKRVYVIDKDFTYHDDKIVLTPASSIPFLATGDLLFNAEKPGWSMPGKVKGTFVLFTEGTFFRSKQISVTYIPKRTLKWEGPVPIFAKTTLPNTIKKLKNKKPLKVVFFGNSIETGANSSAFQSQSPYMPSWPELIVYQLQHVYGKKVIFSNKAVAGTMASWGKDHANELVVPENPDLMIIGFGMNDGSAGVLPEKYKEDIEGILERVRSKNPRAEFILIAPMLANPNSIQSNIQSLYKAELDEIAQQQKGVAVADLTGVTIELLNHKNYQDLTGNNINHPNDYLSRWYAQNILGLLVKEK